MRKALLFITFTLCIYFLKAQTLVASYPFNGNANDASGNGNNGTVSPHNATLTTDRFGNANSAYNFSENGGNPNDVNGGFIQVPNSASLQLTTNYTISLWVNFTSFENGNPAGTFILSKGPYNEGSYTIAGAAFGADPTVQQFYYAIHQGGGDPATQYYVTDASTIIQLNKWYMITSVRNGNTLSLYINGQLRVSQTFSPSALGTPNSSNLYIGGDPTST